VKEGFRFGRVRNPSAGGLSGVYTTDFYSTYILFGSMNAATLVVLQSFLDDDFVGAFLCPIRRIEMSRLSQSGDVVTQNTL
jgi:hypothetical protein